MSNNLIKTVKYEYIDALRGIAILLVIMHHSQPYFAGLNTVVPSRIFESILQNGDKGVTLFFMMSAFTLSLSFSQKRSNEYRPIRNYFIRRMFRIVPLYLLIIAIIMLLKINSPSLLSIAANILFLHGLHPFWINSTVPGGWSVGIEVLFYILFPFLFNLIRSTAAALNATLLTMILAKLVTSWMFKNPLIADQLSWNIFIYENLVSQLPVFLIGVLLFHFLNNRSLSDQERLRLYRSLYFFAAMAFAHLLGANIFKSHYLFALIFAVLAFLVSRFPVKLLVNGWTAKLGKISYSLYLIHLVINNLLIKYHYNHYSNNFYYDVIARFSILLIFSGLISLVTYRVIEIPMQSLGRRIIVRLESRFTPSSFIVTK